MSYLTSKQWPFDCHCTPQIYSIDLGKDKVVACNLIWKYMDSSLNWFMCGDLPTVSSNSAAATKIFAKTVLLKTISSEKWCTYSTNRARAKKFRRIILSVHWCWNRSQFSVQSSFKHIEGLVSHLALRSMIFLIDIS